MVLIAFSYLEISVELLAAGLDGALLTQLEERLAWQGWDTRIQWPQLCIKIIKV